MADPALGPALAALKAAAERLVAWRQEAEAAAKTKDARDAALTIYYAGLLLNTVRQLDARFQGLRDQVEELTDDWDQAQRDELAGRIGALARSEDLLDRLQEAAAFLEAHAQTEAGRVGRMLRKVGKRRSEIEGSLWELRQLANDALQWIGARERAPTPAGVSDVEDAVRSASERSKSNARSCSLGARLGSSIRMQRVREEPSTDDLRAGFHGPMAFHRPSRASGCDPPRVGSLLAVGLAPSRLPPAGIVAHRMLTTYRQ